MSRQFKFPPAAALIFYSMLILSNIFFFAARLFRLYVYDIYIKTYRRNFSLKWKFASWKFPAGMTVTGYGYEAQLMAEFGSGVDHMPVLILTNESYAPTEQNLWRPSASCFMIKQKLHYAKRMTHRMTSSSVPSVSNSETLVTRAATKLWNWSFESVFLVTT